jgi:hypothetical protein
VADQLSLLDSALSAGVLTLTRGLDVVPRGDASAWAILSPCERYRYALGREWDETRATMIICALNPSTADERAEDPTLRKMIGYAKRDGLGSLILVNAFALRATDPKELTRDPAPIGPLNDVVIDRVITVVDAGCLVAAWGKGPSPKLRPRFDALVSVLERAWPGGTLRCWGTNADGSPRHPLYLPSEMPLVEWRPWT